ncbi:hypothetical protein BCY84_19856 [Trypanosoma cruzi cruzi]|nr:hypothetical protein BCY84_19856 [Trypanosoma cruzi cruzi]
MLRTLWGGVNARIRFFFDLVRRDDGRPQFVLLPCCERDFLGLLPMGGVAFWCLGLFRMGFSPAAARFDVFLPLFVRRRRIIRLCGAMCECVGRDKSKTTGGSASVL